MVLYEYLSTTNVTNKQEIVAKIFFNHDGSRSRKMHLEGTLVGSSLIKRLLRSYILACSQTSWDTQLILVKFKLSHKQFWRIVFGMRHIKYFRMQYCRFDGIKAIKDSVQVDSFDIKTFNLYY